MAKEYTPKQCIKRAWEAYNKALEDIKTVSKELGKLLDSENASEILSESELGIISVLIDGINPTAASMLGGGKKYLVKLAKSIQENKHDDTRCVRTPGTARNFAKIISAQIDRASSVSVRKRRKGEEDTCQLDGAQSPQKPKISAEDECRKSGDLSNVSSDEDDESERPEDTFHPPNIVIDCRKTFARACFRRGGTHPEGVGGNRRKHTRGAVAPMATATCSSIHAPSYEKWPFSYSSVISFRLSLNRAWICLRGIRSIPSKQIHMDLYSNIIALVPSRRLGTRIIIPSTIYLFANGVPEIAEIAKSLEILPNDDRRQTKAKLPIPRLSAYSLIEQAGNILGAAHFPPSSTLGQRHLRVLYRRLREGASPDDLLEACRVARDLQAKSPQFLPLRNLLYVWGAALPALLGLARERGFGGEVSDWSKLPGFSNGGANNA